MKITKELVLRRGKVAPSTTRIELSYCPETQKYYIENIVGDRVMFYGYSPNPRIAYSFFQAMIQDAGI